VATHASALKRARQSEKRRLRNKMVKSAIKTHAKKVLQAVEEKNLEKAREALTEAIPAIQRASLKKVLHKKTASRKISRLARSINALRVPA
jgi:small subunit ribosomal protein S20